MTASQSFPGTIDVIVSELKSRFEQSKAANSALRKAGGYAAGHALGYHDALGELLEFISDLPSAGDAQCPIITDEMVESGLAAWMVCEAGPTRQIVRTILEGALSPHSSTLRAPPGGQSMDEAAADNFGLTIDDLGEDDCSCGGGDISGHDSMCPHSSKHGASE